MTDRDGAAVQQRACDSCTERYEAKRPSSRFCSSRCRKRAQRGHVAPAATAPVDAAVSAGAVGELPAGSAPDSGSLRVATLVELTAAGRAGTALGVAAVLLAARIDSGADTGSGIASLAGRWQALMTQALANATVAADPLDEFTQRRRAKASGD